jgi:N-acetylmuramoyl-L-alanine amidase
MAMTGALLLTISACAGQGQVSGAARAGSSTAPPPTSAPPSTTTTSIAPGPPPSSAPSPAAPAKPKPAPAGRVVVLDPGHNGGNAANPARINQAVPAGRGRTKPRNTTGTATNGGYTEHAFPWDVSARVRDILAGRGVRVVLTRPNDTGVGPCVDERAAIGNRENATAVVSIHADGSTSAGAHGFHVAYSAPPLNAAQGEPALRLARTVRDSMRGAGIATSTYIGSAGLSPRDDLAGLNLSERPAVLVECGNMRDAAEAATLSSADGRQRYAAAIAEGILAYLG